MAQEIHSLDAFPESPFKYEARHGNFPRSETAAAAAARPPTAKENSVEQGKKILALIHVMWRGKIYLHDFYYISALS